MTDVASTQAPCSPASFGVDPIDLLVPRPRPLRRSLALAGGLVLIIVAVVLGATTGLIRPRLGLDLAASYTEAGAASRAALSFNVPLNRLSPREAPARSRARSRGGGSKGGSEGRRPPTTGPQGHSYTWGTTRGVLVNRPTAQFCRNTGHGIIVTLPLTTGGRSG
jgi:hypothetical protein